MTDLSNADWRKSSRSGSGNNCVEVADNLPDIVAIRDSKDPNGPALTFSPGDWETFTTGIKRGEFDTLS
ncbi:protein of unknown function [Streptosporangium subroseum]|uniref:DUF397 domain-containing protein n=1 Tax=Streptosporangium subroseum TaxID=106412 RepID=A0A239P7G8_9ACTN|nr:DUF397 domain-containing protein [Streptosporangium subroseum]SNT62548.1 protein of unknown function [Streptosporangium subroseum]